MSGLGRDYLSIELNHGFLLIRWNLGWGEIYVHVSEKVMSDDAWHSVDIRRDQRQFELVIDKTFHVTRSFPGTFISFDLKQGEGDVVIGGMGTPSGFSWNQRLSRIPFVGCFQEINFNNVDIIQELANGKDDFTTQGHPRWSCESSQELPPSTVAKPSTKPLVASEQTTAAAVISAKRVQPVTSFKTTRTVTTKDYTQVSVVSFSGNSVMPCSDDEDDEDDCRPEGSGSEDDSGESGSVVEESGIFCEVSGDREINENKIPNNNSKKNLLKGFPSKAPEAETEGESDISQTPCVGDDEDACEGVDESGQGSAEPGSAGESSASPRPRTLPRDDGNSQVKRRVTVTQDSSKKWSLIAGIIVVATVLVLFCIFAIWWLCKNQNNPQWTGMYNGSREACLQAENGDA